ncbi:MAG: 16S rRNA (cytosine(1402)-N(4))-methyltransferase RsmH [Candidatus Marinimicrobia bacterium]|nr:16S rRNA (cytosine(1402)-N(4))-methyltransferase RsmH [Candidatus Neomarinimicrobiota bacterium]MBL7023276.1 16S rRNA (cytosine(1402)-N(4))-methyltransferase RsmH [Candidatus Neomarinimicrobiota bacterium]MBL7108870.1 16S rRNA (cytosine(1402)-N(4))-methyltransferase RsmH [Candidatus Neomarinimicrobiota bacterium]
MQNLFSHLPVMKQDINNLLVTALDGIYLDGTVGFGGHSGEILEKLKSPGKLIGLDADPDALQSADQYLSSFKTQTKLFSLHHINFRYFPQILDKLEITKVNGILLDLGISSYQIDNAEKGFSFRAEGPLDMRLNPNSELNAKDYLYSVNENELGQIIRDYGEERYYKKIALSIVKRVKENKMNTTLDLKDAITSVVFGKFQIKSVARVFQAIRIHINDELVALREALVQSKKYLSNGGRLAVITFHSLEDRIVKRFINDESKTCVCPRELPICACDTIPSFKWVSRKAILPSEKEIEENPRARSAKLRIAERI